jgi:hypothetical protein
LRAFGSAQRRHNDGRVPDPVFQAAGDVRHHLAVEAEPGHQQEMHLAAVEAEAADVDAAPLAADELERGVVEPSGDADLARPEVAGAAGEGADGDVRAEHPRDDLAQGAVAAAGDDDVEAVRHRLPGEVGGFGLGGRLADHSVPVVGGQRRQRGRQVNPAVSGDRVRDQGSPYRGRSHRRLLRWCRAPPREPRPRGALHAARVPPAVRTRPNS